MDVNEEERGRTICGRANMIRRRWSVKVECVYITWLSRSQPIYLQLPRTLRSRKDKKDNFQVMKKWWHKDEEQDWSFTTPC